MIQKPTGYWTKERCQEEALRYLNKMSFKCNSSGAYNKCVKSGWLIKICKHMNNNVIWSKNKILSDVLFYNSMSDIRKNNKKLLGAITRYKITTEVYDILGRTGNRFNKCIYSYEFPDNHVYVGLTYNLEERQKNRDKSPKDSVTKYINESGLTPIRKQLTNYINVDEAIKLEEYYVNKYKEDNWNILNRTATGAIGGCIIKWTKEACQEEALKYSSKVRFSIGSSSAHATSKREKWIDEICSHMVEVKKTNGYWTKEKCFEITKQYNSITSLAREYVSVYTIIKRNNWIDELTAHMTGKNFKPNGYWNINSCSEEALKYETRIDFKTKSESAYTRARKDGFLNEICQHMKRKLKKNE